MREKLPCLPLIQERFLNVIKEDLGDCYPEFEMTMFPQIWSKTALGFGIIGGLTSTKAYTTVVRDAYTKWCGVFFGEQLVYKIKNPNEKFQDDVRGFCMKPVYQKDVYIRKDEN